MHAFHRRAVAALAVAGASLLPGVAFAQSFIDRVQQGTTAAGKPAGFETGGSELIDIIGGVINVALSFVGVVLLVLMLYAGFLWMTAGGNEEKVKEARQIIVNSVIGLIITLSAFAISGFVLERIAASQGQPTASDTRPTPQ